MTNPVDEGEMGVGSVVEPFVTSPQLRSVSLGGSGIQRIVCAPRPDNAGDPEGAGSEHWIVRREHNCAEYAGHAPKRVRFSQRAGSNVAT